MFDDDESDDIYGRYNPDLHSLQERFNFLQRQCPETANALLEQYGLTAQATRLDDLPKKKRVDLAWGMSAPLNDFKCD